MRALAVCLWVSVLGSAGALGGETEATNDGVTRLSGTYGWSGLVVSKVGDGVSNLTAADVDGDGRGDLALVQNGRARIVMLRLPKPGEQAGDDPKKGGRTKDRINELADESFFVRDTVPVEEKVSAIAFADLDADASNELLWLGDSGRVSIARRDASGAFAVAQRLEVTKASTSAGAIRTGDVDGDGRTDLVVLGVDDTFLFLSSASKDGRFGDAKKLPNATRAADVVELVDVDGDAVLDLVYAAGGTEWPLRVRLGRGNASFGPEVASRFADIRALALADLDGKPGVEAVAIRTKSGRLAALRYGAVDDESGPLSALRSAPFSSIKDADQREYVLADLSGDGRAELLVAEPSAAQVVLHRDLVRGGRAPQISASFSGVSKPRVADVDGDGKPELIVASAAERVIGISRFNETSGLDFPEALTIPRGGDLIALDAADLDGDSKAEIVIVSGEGKGKDRKGALMALDAAGTVKSEFDLGKLAKDPNDMWLIDLDRDGKRDVLLFFPRELPKLLLAAKDGTGYSELKLEERGLGLLSGLERTQLAHGDIDGDGQLELIVPKGNFARSIFLDATGKPQTVAQLNLEESSGVVERVALLDLDGDGKNELVVHDKSTGRLEVHAIEVESTSRLAKVDLAGVAPTFLAASDLDGDGASDVLVAAADRFAVVKNGARDPGFVPFSELEIPLKNAFPDRLAVGDVNGDGKLDVVATETVDHQLVVTAMTENALEYAIRFTVFETRMFQADRGGREPREIRIGDCTGDGKADIAVIVHDRVIVYPQE